jgi:drug/metabolite transporter (DMT)-like permease
MELLILVFGVFCCSTAVILIKASGEHAVVLAALRLLFAGVFLTPLAWRDYRRHREHPGVPRWQTTVWPALLLALHFISWIYAARLTTATNATLIVNLVPIVMPFLMHFLIAEQITGRELAGTALALVGLVVLSAADFHVSREHFFGDVLSFFSMLLFAGYLALGRKNRHVVSLWLYVTPLYYLAGLICLAVSLFFVNPIKPYPARELWLIMGLAFIPTVLGHSALNHAMKKFRGQVVSVVNLGQFVFAGIMAYVLFHEVPRPVFYLASALLVAAVLVVVRQPTPTNPAVGATPVETET